MYYQARPTQCPPTTLVRPLERPVAVVPIVTQPTSSLTITFATSNTASATTTIGGPQGQPIISRSAPPLLSRRPRRSPCTTSIGRYRDLTRDLHSQGVNFIH